MGPPGRKHPADKGTVPLHVTSTGATMIVRTVLSLLLGVAEMYCAVVMTVLLVSTYLLSSISKESMLVLSALGELD